MEIKKIYDLFLTTDGISFHKARKNTMFFNIKREKIFDALKKDVSYVVTNNKNKKFIKYCSEYNNKIIFVDNVAQTMIQLAKYHREYLNFPIIAITGSCGKTTTKELISTVLSKKYSIKKTRQSCNTILENAIDILNTKKNDILILEIAGGRNIEKMINKFNIIKPNIGIITKIGLAHIGRYENAETIKNIKGQLYDYFNENDGVVFCPLEDTVLYEMTQQRKNMDVKYYSNTIGKDYKNNLIGDYNINNISTAVAIGKYFGISEEDIKEAIASYVPKNHRSQLKITNKNNKLVIDCYNANPTAMEACLNSFNKMNDENKVLILGDMLEMGSKSIDYHKEVLLKADTIKSDMIILVGKDFSKAYDEIKEKLKSNFILFKNVEKCKHFFTINTLNNKLILLKGSHGIHLEKLIKIF